MIEIYFFGCWRDVGHYMHVPDGRRCWDVATPWGHDIDSRLCPNGKNRDRRIADEVEGHAAIHHKNGWTGLAWWDRSVDKRGACNAGLYARATLNAQQILAIGRAQFPSVFGRFAYEIKVIA